MSNIKKRGRKKKDENIQMMIIEPVIESIQYVINNEESKIEPQALKKRGRKPKGGKLINKNMIEPEQQLA